MSGLSAVFYLSAALCLIAAVASLLRGKRYIHDTMATGAVAVGTSQTVASNALQQESSGVDAAPGQPAQPLAEGAAASPNGRRQPTARAASPSGQGAIIQQRLEAEVSADGAGHNGGTPNGATSQTTEHEASVSPDQTRSEEPAASNVEK